MAFVSGPVTVTLGDVDISDHVASVTIDGIVMDGWAAPTLWPSPDDDDAHRAD